MLNFFTTQILSMVDTIRRYNADSLNALEFEIDFPGGNTPRANPPSLWAVLQFQYVVAVFGPYLTSLSKWLATCSLFALIQNVETPVTRFWYPRGIPLYSYGVVAGTYCCGVCASPVKFLKLPLLNYGDRAPVYISGAFRSSP